MIIIVKNYRLFLNPEEILKILKDNNDEMVKTNSAIHSGVCVVFDFYWVYL